MPTIAFSTTRSGCLCQQRRRACACADRRDNPSGGRANFLLQLVAADGDLVGVDDDDEVAAIDIGRERRLVLAAQQLGCFDGEPAEHHVRGVDDVPRTRGVTRLRRVRRHSAYLFFSGLLPGWDPGMTRVPVGRDGGGWSRRPTLTREPGLPRGAKPRRTARQRGSLPATIRAGQNADARS